MKKIRWGLIFIALFFLLFLASLGGGFYFYQEQAVRIDYLTAKLRAFEASAVYTQKILEYTEKDIDDLGIKVESLGEDLANRLTAVDVRLASFGERLNAQERLGGDVSLKMSQVSTKLGSLEDRFVNIEGRFFPKAQVDLGNISVERRR